MDFVGIISRRPTPTLGTLASIHRIRKKDRIVASMSPRWVPKKHPTKQDVDLSCATLVFGSKRKRESDPEDGVGVMDTDVETNFEELPGGKRRAYEGTVAGRVSRRPWKAAEPRRASATIVKPSSHSSRSTWEKKMEAKRAKREFQDYVNEVKEEKRTKAKEERERREEKKRLKEENTVRTGLGVQVIKNTRKLKKMSKKEKKKLITADPDLVMKKR